MPGEEVYYLEFNHVTVLLSETLELLNIDPDGIYIDGTAGGGGLSEAIASKLSNKGKLICIDLDPDAIMKCKNRLKDYGQVTVVKSNFTELSKVIDGLGLKFVDGIVFDLGVSSYQLDNALRGFSYNKNAPLDMRMSKNGKTAGDVINSLDLKSLEYIIGKYGEENFAHKIAESIVKERDREPIISTTRLADIVKKSVPAAVRRQGNPARKTFQAIRIYVNNELDNLKIGLEQAFLSLKLGGRLAVITFHSLEDGITKREMKEWRKGCICPSDFPICICGNKPKVKIITKKCVKPSLAEIENNFRSRSARLRVCEKI